MKSQSEFDIGAQVRSWRKARGLLQKELATNANMNVTQLWALEHGRFSPSIKTAERIANALGITLMELLSSPDGHGNSPDKADGEKKRLHTPICEIMPVLKSSDGVPGIDTSTQERLIAQIEKAREFESKHSALTPTNLPLSSQVSTSEAGAEQLAYALRAHLDIGSAIVHDTIPLFESYGVRVLDAELPEKPDSISFYDTRNKNFTVFIAEQFKKKPWRRDFLLLTEIGRAFLFTRHDHLPYHETARSRRFAHHFAATFLQPESAVRNAVYSLNIKPDEWTYELLLRMKERFGVSAEAFAIRLKELALITRRKADEYIKQIKQHYKSTANAEPMAKKRSPGRVHDLAALSPTMPLDRDVETALPSTTRFFMVAPST